MKIPAVLARSDLGRNIWAFRREFAWVGLFSFFANVLMLSPTVYMLQVYDRVMLSQNEFTLIALTVVITLFFGMMAFAEWVRSRLLVRAGVRFDEMLNSKVFKASFEENLNQVTSTSVQSFSDLTSLRQFLTGNGIFAIFDAPWTIIYILVLFNLHLWLGLGAVLFSVVFLALAWYSHLLTAAGNEKANQAQIKVSSYITEKSRHAETVQALGMISHIKRHWGAMHGAQNEVIHDSKHLQHKIQALVKFAQYSQQSLILALGALLAIRGEISAGAMIASNALVGNALRPISVLVATWKQFADAQNSYLRLEALLDKHPERSASHASEVVRGQITLEGLVAKAPARRAPILNNLSVRFDAGEVVAIVGPSGAGKSTLARCIIGIWPDTSGRVLLDGQEISAWAREELGPHLGYLPQDIELFEGTIAENIGRFGDINPELVIEAAQRTGIHEMVLRLPRGYDTPIGEAGGMLSGGQRQRVGLARAIYGSPEMVVLDEPNANLDDAGEAALLKTIKDLRERGSTVFMVVHQRNILVAADRVLVLNNGEIKQFGRILPASVDSSPKT